MIVELYQNHNVLSKAPVPWYLLLGGGIGVVVGLATWGYRVMRTIGEGFTNVRRMPLRHTARVDHKLMSCNPCRSRHRVALTWSSVLQ